MESARILRCWENRLRYEIIVSGKAASLGHPLPVMLILETLENIKVSHFMVYLFENVSYLRKSGDNCTLSSLQRRLLLDSVDSSGDYDQDRAAARDSSFMAALKNLENGPVEVDIDLQLPL